jgi:hypothetical protein
MVTMRAMSDSRIALKKADRESDVHLRRNRFVSVRDRRA